MNEYLDYGDFLRLCREIINSETPSYAFIAAPDGKCDDFHIFQLWATGGIQGGSCWSDGVHYTVAGEDPPATWPELDSLLRGLFPNLKYFDYLEVIVPLITLCNYTDYEYYGNHTFFTKKIIELKKLHSLYLSGKLG